MALLHPSWSAPAQLPPNACDLSSLTRDQTCNPCIERQTLNHWTAREVPAVPLSCLQLYSWSQVVSSQTWFGQPWLKTRGTLSPVLQSPLTMEPSYPPALCLSDQLPFCPDSHLCLFHQGEMFHSASEFSHSPQHSSDTPGNRLGHCRLALFIVFQRSSSSLPGVQCLENWLTVFPF